jgi:AraC-like DNA-binding protein
VTAGIHEHIRFSLFQVNDFSYEKHCLDHEAQPFFTFSFISKGSVCTTSEGITHYAQSGDVMVHRPGLPFSVHANQPGTHMYINIALSVMEHVDFFQLHPLPKIVTLLDPKRYRQTFIQLKSAWNRSTDGLRDMQSTMLAFQLLHEIIESARISQTSKAHGHPSVSDNRLAQVVPFIENNLKTRITREKLASIALLNPVYFSRIFRKTYGITPMSMVHQLRMKRAVQMLEDPVYTIEFIAAECGFYDASYFNRVFQQVYNMTPGTFRRKVEQAKA